MNDGYFNNMQQIQYVQHIPNSQYYVQQPTYISVPNTQVFLVPNYIGYTDAPIVAQPMVSYVQPHHYQTQQPFNNGHLLLHHTNQSSLTHYESNMVDIEQKLERRSKEMEQLLGICSTNKQVHNNVTKIEECPDQEPFRPDLNKSVTPTEMSPFTPPTENTIIECIDVCDDDDNVADDHHQHQQPEEEHVEYTVIDSDDDEADIIEDDEANMDEADMEVNDLTAQKHLLIDMNQPTTPVHYQNTKTPITPNKPIMTSPQKINNTPITPNTHSPHSPKKPSIPKRSLQHSQASASKRTRTSPEVNHMIENETDPKPHYVPNTSLLVNPLTKKIKPITGYIKNQIKNNMNIIFLKRNMKLRKNKKQKRRREMIKHYEHIMSVITNQKNSKSNEQHPIEKKSTRRVKPTHIVDSIAKKNSIPIPKLTIKKASLTKITPAAQQQSIEDKERNSNTVVASDSLLNGNASNAIITFKDSPLPPKNQQDNVPATFSNLFNALDHYYASNSGHHVQPLSSSQSISVDETLRGTARKQLFDLNHLQINVKNDLFINKTCDDNAKQMTRIVVNEPRDDHDDLLDLVDVIFNQ
ncbi:col27a1a [Acrasis kona]|uniref:Col27a1a n=1 Tax=Acrasis kona TaxID=1008807 RepID=A0AAW2YHW2_9EUKA